MTTETPCSDCTISPSTHTIRRRPLCPTCLQRFVSSKVLKRMESLRPRNQKSSRSSSAVKSRFLIPLSGDTSSLALLTVMVAQIRRQIAKTGRTGYELVVIHADVAGSESQELTRWWERVQNEFPECEFVDLVPLSSVFRVDQDISAHLSLLNIDKQSAEVDEAFLFRLFASAKSATARSEMRELLLKRLMIALAKEQDCEGILWGHSDTKLAATILALVAKGRGTAVSGELADGSRLWDMEFNYPLRDLFQPELETYLQCASQSVQECLLVQDSVEAPVSLKATSIDALLGTYITGQGEKYPSIMANVVRTAGKLQAPDMTDGHRCRLCAGHMASVTARGDSICYGCERLKQDMRG